MAGAVLGTEKRCSKCGARKPLEAFAADKPRANGKRNADGRHSWCRECQREAARAWAASHRDRARENTRRHYAENPQAHMKVHLRWCRANPAAQPAHAAVRLALRIGRLVMPDTCDRCGTSGPVLAHHEDYARPLWLESLCQSCHRSTHGRQGTFADKGTGHVYCEPVARLRTPNRMGLGGDAADRPGIRAGGQSVALSSVLGPEGAGNCVRGYERVPPDALRPRGAAAANCSAAAAAQETQGGVAVAVAGTRAEVQATGQKAEAATRENLPCATADLQQPGRPLGSETAMPVALGAIGNRAAPSQQRGGPLCRLYLRDGPAEARGSRVPPRGPLFFHGSSKFKVPSSKLEEDP